MPILEPKEDDVLTQGTTYEEENEDILDSNDEVSPEKPDQKKPSGKGVILIAACLIVILVVIVFSCGKITKKNELPEDESPTVESTAFTYVDVEVDLLRQNGYTGDEIEEFEVLEIPAVDKIKEAEEKREKKIEEEILPYLDGRSEEFKMLEKNTWVGQSEFTYDPSTYNTWSRKGALKNVDYEKVPLHGYQCFLKVMISKGNKDKGIEPAYVFMSIDPIRYSELDNSGNINVNIDYYYIKDTKTTIVVDIREERITDN